MSRWLTGAGQAQTLLRALFDGDSVEVATVLEGVGTLDVPRLVIAQSPLDVAELVDAWSKAYEFELVDSVIVNVIDTERGIVTEIRATLRTGEREFVLPFAIVESVESGGPLIRMYHSERLIHGERRGRRAVWPVDPTRDPTPLAEISPVVARYMGAIAGGNVDEVIACFDSHAALDNGVRPVKMDELPYIFSAMTQTGGARLVRQREFDDGSVVAFEYTGLPKPQVDPSAPRTPPGGGIGIYTHNADGLLLSVRMYDDFDPEGLIAVGKAS